MEWWQAIILGLVEGVTEYLPVSSTGHLIIASDLMRLGQDERSKTALDAFTIVIQGGAILAVAGLYRLRVAQMFRGVVRIRRPRRDQLESDIAGRALLLRLLIAFLPAAIIGVMVDDWIEANLFSLWPVVGALMLGGVFMILLDRWRKRRDAREDETRDNTTPEDLGPDLHEIPLRSALIIGLLQCIAMWPGTSRSMMTITGGVIVGMRPARAAEFSFLLGLPTLGGATVYKFLKDLKRAHDTGGESMIEIIGITPVLIGIVVATLSAAFAVKWLITFLTRHGLEPFGWYRIAIGVVLASLALAGLVSVD